MARSKKVLLFENPLKTPRHVEEFLNGAWEDGVETFLVALIYIIEIREGGAVPFWKKNKKLSTTSLYKQLANKANPSIEYLSEIMAALGIKLRFKIESR